MIQVVGHFLRELSPVAIAATGVALIAAGYKIFFMVASAVTVSNQMVQGELCTMLNALAAVPDVVVKLDADVSFEPGYFERLVAEFDRVWGKKVVRTRDVVEVIQTLGSVTPP